MDEQWPRFRFPAVRRLRRRAVSVVPAAYRVCAAVVPRFGSLAINHSGRRSGDRGAYTDRRARDLLGRHATPSSLSTPIYPQWVPLGVTTPLPYCPNGVPRVGKVTYQ